MPLQHKDALLADLQASACMGQSQRAAARLLSSYEDRDGSLREEVALVEGRDAAEPSSPPDAMISFYRRLGDIREYHRRYPSTPEDSTAVATALASATGVLDSFSPDELYGRYIDLAAPFEEWCNLPGVKDARMDAASEGDGGSFSALARSDYIAYLRRFSDVHTELPASTKISRRFQRYIASLAQTLLSFAARSQPLLDLRAAVFSYARTACDVAISACSVPAAQQQQNQRSAVQEVKATDLTTFADVDALAAAFSPGDALSAELRARGLKAGGSHEERIARLWAVRGMQPHEYPRKFLAPASAPLARKAPVLVQVEERALVESPEAVGAVVDVPDASAIVASVLGAENSRGPAGQHRIATVLADLVIRLGADVLDAPIRDAGRRLERRLTKTRAELEAERIAAEAEVSAPVRAGGGGGAAAMAGADEDEDEDKPIYNPKKLPLGWDGKPMPYWLWKLQGLNIEYRCEICGDAVIMGRRNFDRHFQEARHAYGMRCLGIPNTKHFHDVVRIEDARRLYEKLRAQLAAEVFVAAHEEEWEDSNGNVLTRQAYEGALRSGMQQQHQG